MITTVVARCLAIECRETDIFWQSGIREIYGSDLERAIRF
ncbi:hypothetical protein LMG24238_05485 [Paraburkholderia sediminicola]|uniref:Uncharacterized protein n=1 Tax=Paraburkholderia sediminicola TaxID=458836 RepID=A0A6J5C9W6_9BURK|nr:hypothetical protein LMG24238_05485 [Paraburkholderia sediminicola]